MSIGLQYYINQGHRYVTLSKSKIKLDALIQMVRENNLICAMCYFSRGNGIQPLSKGFRSRVTTIMTFEVDTPDGPYLGLSIDPTLLADVIGKDKIKTDDVHLKGTLLGALIDPYFRKVKETDKTIIVELEVFSKPADLLTPEEIGHEW